MTEPEIVYGQKIIQDYLRTHPDVSAKTNRIVSKPPDEGMRSTPWIMFTLLSAPQESSHPFDWNVEFYFQLDVYAGATGGLPQCWDIVRTVRKAIVKMPENGVEDAVCNKTKVFGFNPDLDTDMEPARDRFIMTASAWLHAEPA